MWGCGVAFLWWLEVAGEGDFGGVDGCLEFVVDVFLVV